MPETRKFWKTIVTIEVLSHDDTPPAFASLGEVDYEITDGHASGDVAVSDPVQLTPQDMAKALIAQGSDPEFFGLDKDGNVIDDDTLDVLPTDE